MKEIVISRGKVLRGRMIILQRRDLVFINNNNLIILIWRREQLDMKMKIIEEKLLSVDTIDSIIINIVLMLL
jgi:hypothetical protein